VRLLSQDFSLADSKRCRSLDIADDSDDWPSRPAHTSTGECFHSVVAMMASGEEIVFDRGNRRFEIRTLGGQMVFQLGRAGETNLALGTL
jgi:hypothetical protein